MSVEIALAAVFAVVMGVGFPMVVRRGEAARGRITPRRTIAVALLTLVAVVAPYSAAALITTLVAGCPCPNYGWSLYGHPLWHFFWAVLAVAVAFGLHRFRRAWLATGWTERSLAAAELLVRAMVVGSALAAVGAAIPFQPLSPSEGLWWWRLDYLLALIFHSTGEILVVGSLLSLPVVCLVMLGVGIRGATRPAVQPS